MSSPTKSVHTGSIQFVASSGTPSPEDYVLASETKKAAFCLSVKTKDDFPADVDSDFVPSGDWTAVVTPTASKAAPVPLVAKFSIDDCDDDCDDDDQTYSFDAIFDDVQDELVGEHNPMALDWETRSEEVENEQLDDIFHVASSDESADYFVDELQALNTALCFLCSINVDAREVDTFLKVHPEALLLEGACLLPEDSALYILEQHTHHCKCDGSCRENRRRVVDLVNMGYETYHSQRDRQSETKLNASSFEKLVQAEHNVRQLRKQELAMRDTLVETAVEVEAYQQELDRELFKQNYRMRHSKPSGLALLACRNHKTDASGESRMSVIEYHVGTASNNMRSVEREHKKLLEKIGEGRREQFNVLKTAFKYCRRHDICSVGYVAPVPESATTISTRTGHGEP